ncbi:hypothetical protein NKH77_10495 [Streptomyces sp. M19]
MHARDDGGARSCGSRSPCPGPTRRLPFTAYAAGADSGRAPDLVATSAITGVRERATAESGIAGEVR